MTSVIRRALRSKIIIGLILLLVLVIGVVNVFKKDVVTFDKLAGQIHNKRFVNNTVSEVKVVSSDAGKPFLIPLDDVLNKLSEQDLLKIYWRYINTVQILCRNQTRIGALKDGGKEMCEDDLYKLKKPCLVYSFGSNFQFDFDVPMNKFYGCEVFTFDPSMNINGKKLPSEIKFELRGLSGRDYVNEKKWRMSTLASILQDNNHQDRIIDILKIDVEGAEWEALPAMIEKGVHKRVKQLLIEVHAGRMGPLMNLGFWGGVNLPGQLRVLRMLHESGFRIFMREHNLYSVSSLNIPPHSQITIVNEISLININFNQPS